HVPLPAALRGILIGEGDLVVFVMVASRARNLHIRLIRASGGRRGHSCWPFEDRRGGVLHGLNRAVLHPQVTGTVTSPRPSSQLDYYLGRVLTFVDKLLIPSTHLSLLRWKSSAHRS